MDSYEKVIGKIQGYDQKESIATHFYSYWQAYHFYEVTKTCTLDYIINVFDEEIHNKLRHLQIPLKKIFSRRLPLKHDRIKKDFWGQSKNLDLLSFYVQTIKKYESIVSRSKLYQKNTLRYLDEKSTTKYYNRIKTLTKIIVKKYNFYPTEAYNFLRFLCGRYDEYKQKKKDKLTESIKNDIYYLILMMQNGFDLEFETINKYLGRLTQDFGNTLDVIFPPIFAKEKENVKYTLNSFLSSNFNFHKYENVSKYEINDFLNFIDSNNLQLFYYSLGQINLTQLRDQTIYLHVFYLSLLFENIVKSIARGSEKKDLIISFSKRKELLKTISAFFQKEGWYTELKKNWPLTEVLFNSNVENIICKKFQREYFIRKMNGTELLKCF